MLTTVTRRERKKRVMNFTMLTMTIIKRKIKRNEMLNSLKRSMKRSKTRLEPKMLALLGGSWLKNNMQDSLIVSLQTKDLIEARSMCNRCK